MSLKNKQQQAMKNHCRLAGECVNPKFAWLDGMFSFVLTVNSGYE